MLDKDVRRVACALALRVLTSPEWKRFLGGLTNLASKKAEKTIEEMVERGKERERREEEEKKAETEEEEEEEEWKDIGMYCMECQTEFVHTVGEQEFFYEKGLKDPKRCKECRWAKKWWEGGEKNGVWKTRTEEKPWWAPRWRKEWEENWQRRWRKEWEKHWQRRCRKEREENWQRRWRKEREESWQRRRRQDWWNEWGEGPKRRQGQKQQQQQQEAGKGKKAGGVARKGWVEKRQGGLRQQEEQQEKEGRRETANSSRSRETRGSVPGPVDHGLAQAVLGRPGDHAMARETRRPRDGMGDM
jgi:hypothetical protein